MVKKISNETLLMLVINELSEAIEADRQNIRANIVYFDNEIDHLEDAENYNDLPFAEAFQNYIKDTLEYELADAVIHLLDLARFREYIIQADYKYHALNKFIPELIFDICDSVIRTTENENIGQHLQFIIIMIESICIHLSIDLCNILK